MNKSLLEWVENKDYDFIVYKYILFKISEWYSKINSSKNNDISFLKFFNLLFLINTVDPIYYYNLGFRFRAYPSGAFEAMLYDNIATLKSIIDKEGANFEILNQMDLEKLDNKVKNKIDDSFTKLEMLNYYLVTYSASRLTDIIHKYACWILAYNKFFLKGDHTSNIPIELMSGEKFYYS